MELTSSNTQLSAWRRYLPWLCLLCVLASFVIAVVRVHPTNFFGYSEDDSIYFSSARALAEGKGYVLESFPGTPAATKYPVFYPWMLSWIWRWNPAFPANLSNAIAVTMAFGVAYLTAAFLFFRRLRGITEPEALVLTAFCALHPLVIFFSGQILTEIPFSALMLAAIVLAESSVRGEAKASAAAFCGVVTGLAILLRVLGVPVAGGIAAAFVVRRAWRQLAVFCACVAPFFGALAWRVIFSHAAVSPASGPAASSRVWAQTWAYYTNYMNVWKEGVPNASAFAAMLKSNAFWLLRAPANYFASPWPAGRTFSGQVVAIVVTVVIVKGILRFARDSGAWSVPWVLAFYVAVLFLWVYIDDGRFLIPFLPIFAAGLWVEVKYMLKMVHAALTGTRPMADKVVATAFSIVLAIFICAVSLDFVGGLRREVVGLSKDRAVLLQEKREAYDWLTSSTDRNARVVALEDASLYLYSGREALRPFLLTAAPLYLPGEIGEVPESVTEVARAVGADYWVISDDDYNLNWAKASAKSRAKAAVLLPLVYSSPAGHVRIYSLGCNQPPADSFCESAKGVLSPGAAEKASPESSHGSKAWN
jgi:4-amino-4-deoxy-L-arabinose transferase-like glycosyltransferase